MTDLGLPQNQSFCFSTFRIIRTSDYPNIHSAFALPSLCLRSKSGNKVHPAWEESSHNHTHPFVG